jgi:hypothetical protein
VLSLDSLDDVVDRCCKVELASFQALGSRPICDAASAVFFSGASRAHAFRAELLESCAPFASGFARTETKGLPLEIDAVLQAIVDDGADRDVVDAVVDVFYPAMRDQYESLRLVADGPGDTFVRRTFRRCRDDVAGILEEATALGARNPESQRSRIVRVLLVDAGGPFGAIAERSRIRPAGRSDPPPGRTA